LAPPGDQFIAYSKLSATSGRTLAGFGQVTWKFLPELEISAGSRYTDETKDSFFGQPFVNPFYAAVYPAGDRVTANQHFYNFSPETTLTWNAGRDLTLYGAYKTGYKSGGSSNSAITSAFGNGAQDLTFKPETVRGIEAGVKAALLDRTLRFNFNAYRYEFSDL
jgi:outer membrane receptor protein involved in Fe transport